MNTEVQANRTKVIEALESGKYKQTVRVFCNRAESCYCAWGVMLDTFGGINHRGVLVDIETKAEVSVFEVLNKVFHALGMDRDNMDDYDALYSTVTRMNDCGATFEQIAQYLRQLWNKNS